MASLTALSQQPVGSVGYSYVPLSGTDSQIYQAVNHEIPANNQLARRGQESRYIGPDQREYAGTVSHVHGIVPTGLFTTYVPVAQPTGQARQAAYANAQDFAKVHEGRMKSVKEQPPNSLVVYYTDDLYPPYYAKAKKVQSQKRGKPRCCQ
eukprot:Gregarina_sp_Poly_1__2454@NODE_1662_length_3588_cov_232_506106_g1090_i0_p3_GENE_NODE_1662_length_3588_cov_232_506106_g1090_i0NODE_1662_length_3588_cov_232_506106_g1090_i0_p3_ORF_typecomplete_len151_score13_31_NODE_1662_length_3588_cov_232_506106_g1090_i070522